MGGLLRAIAGLLFLVCSGMAARSDSGNEILAQCQDDAWFSKGYCLGYIMGVSRIAQEAGQMCNAGATTKGQLKDVVVKYLLNHPEFRHYSAESLAVVALGEAFPCGKR